MAKQAEITYLLNSGFIVELSDKLLLFDYFRDPAQALPNLSAGGKRLYVFSSHQHFDHFNPEIAAVSDQAERYFLSFDIRGTVGACALPAEKITYLNAYDAYVSDAIRVVTYSSTDEGVSFLVEVGGWRIFHAGDFNWWHWKGDTAENIQLAKNAFMKQMKRLDGLTADIAFFPVDKRLEEFCAIGAKEFCRRTEIQYLITMHNAEHSAWKVPADFLTPGSMTSIWSPEEPGDQIKLIK